MLKIKIISFQSLQNFEKLSMRAEEEGRPSLRLKLVFSHQFLTTRYDLISVLIFTNDNVRCGLAKKGDEIIRNEKKTNKLTIENNYKSLS